MITFTRTDSENNDFMSLVALLDADLKVRDGVDHSFYAQYNKIDMIRNAIVCYENNKPVGCGAFKAYDDKTVEIKRMFVQKNYRGLGLSKKILHELEQWAIENKYSQALLETSIHFQTARRLYETSGYTIIPNYPPYVGLAESVCMRKALIIPLSL